jgi:hypothetical protein
MKFQNKIIAGFILLGSLSTVAQAATVIISGIGNTTYTATTPGNVGTLSAGTSYIFGDLGGPSLLSLNPNLSNSSTTATKIFYDDFVFTILSGSSFNNSFLASLQTQGLSSSAITGFSESLYSGSVASFSTTGANPFGTTSAIATTTTNTLSVINLGAGTYTLQFSGTIGTAASLLLPSTGSFLSTINISPVPEADTYAMMLAGLSLLGFMVQRRKNQQQS